MTTGFSGSALKIIRKMIEAMICKQV